MEGFRGFVAFRLGQEHFAVPLEAVREIVPVPHLTPIPTASRHVRGLMTLRNTLLPVMDLASRLGIGEELPGGGREILVLDVGGFRFGVLIDGASHANLETVGEPGAGPGEDRFGGLVSGVLRSGDQLLPLLDPERLLDADPDLLRRFRRDDTQDHSRDRGKESMAMVTFDLVGETYALPLGDVREILRYAEPFRVPEAPPWIRGVLSVRGTILPVLDPVRRLGLGGRSPSEGLLLGAKIVVVEYGARRAGILVDGIREVLECVASDVQPPPSLAVSPEGKSALSGVVAFRGNLVGLLDKEVLLGERELALASEEGDLSGAVAAERDEETFIVFAVEGKTLGLPIGVVREITRVGAVAPLPGAPDYLEGSTNLRGEILSVVNLRKRFGSFREVEDPEGRRLLVVETGDRRVGYLVDAVQGVEELSRSSIGAPPFSSRDFGEASRFVVGVARLGDDRILQIVDPELL